MPKQQENVEARLIAKAWKDEAFNQALINDPKGTIEKEFGKKVPDAINIQVHEQTESTLHLVLPPKPQEGELSDEELQKAAGGAGFGGAASAGGGGAFGLRAFGEPHLDDRSL